MRLIGFYACIIGVCCLGPATAKETVQVAPTKERVVAAYAEHLHTRYSDSVDSAKALQKKIDALLDTPSAGTLAAARAAWIDARRKYNPTEAYRFYGGPIDSAKDGVEVFLNAWPVDEGYIDYVEGNPQSGIVHDTKNVPLISPEVLQAVNEQGGEANVSSGWHAIEFLLWGQDFATDGPGARPHTDYIIGKTPGVERRREYLSAASTLLVTHLEQVRDAWAPDEDNYRKQFVANPDESMKHIFTGLCVMFGFELSGERLSVAYETGDQEDEPSCFSDTTHLDTLDNAEGVFEVLRLMAPLAQKTDPELAKQLQALETKTRDALKAIPVPFDKTLTSENQAVRDTILRGVEALEEHAMTISALAHSMGYSIPLRPE